MNENWYALYTKPRWEKKVASTLTQQSVCNYCPLNRVIRQWSDRKKVVMEPLFASYVFVKVPESKLPTLKRIDGILHYVTWLGKPAVIREDEITLIRQFLKEHSNVKTGKPNLHINDIVRINEGMLIDKEGKVVELKNQTAKVVLPSLGFMLYVELAQASLEVLNFF